ncbi:MAG: glycosyltransferase, partial [Mastigocoleus sp. MO_167.B18]|nr:glycosyltransferase [Mastigocoleus sp. MO_167.B18]
MKLKILILSTSLGLGGADKEIITLASNLINRNNQVKLISMTPLGIMGLEAQTQGLDVISLNMSRGVPDISVVPRLINIIKTYKPDIIHSNMFHANLLARLVRVFYHVPVLISTAQNIDESHGKIWRDIAY